MIEQSPIASGTGLLPRLLRALKFETAKVRPHQIPAPALTPLDALLGSSGHPEAKYDTVFGLMNALSTNAEDYADLTLEADCPPLAPVSVNEETRKQ